MTGEHSESGQIIESYIRGELADAEIEQFEQRLLWDTELQEELRLSQMLRDGMQTLARDQGTAHRSSSVLESPRYAAAASVLLMVTSFGWLFSWLGSDSAPANNTSGRVFSLDIVRSAPSVSQLPIITTGDGPVTLLVYPNLEEFSQFIAALDRQPEPGSAAGSGDPWKRVWQGEATELNGDTVAVTLQGRMLAPGIHRLRVRGWQNGKSSEIAGEVYFRVSVLQ